MEERYFISPTKTIDLIIELENENHLHFTRQELAKPSSLSEYVFSRNAIWYWITIMIVVVTTIAVFTITGNGDPLIYIRNSFGVIFILFLPGFALLKALFPEKVSTNPIKNMDTIECVALSFGLSLVVIPMVGLIMNFTPWGIRLAPITLSLLLLTVVSGSVGILREYHLKLNFPNPNDN